MDKKKPLVIDLDGTLIKTDMLYETFISALKNNFIILFFVPYWLFRGKAYLKQQLACRSSIDVEVLPYELNFLTWIKGQKKLGRYLVLCTASDQKIAEKIADFLGCFDRVVGSSNGQNIRADVKAQKIIEILDTDNFDYAGNSIDDLKVWKRSRSAILVNPSKSVEKVAKRNFEVTKEFQSEKQTIKSISAMLRWHQWVKNILIFTPIFAAGQVTISNISIAFLGLIAFSLCASAVYILNDLIDLESDRHHKDKCNRPFASGKLSILTGFIAAPLLLFLSGCLAINVGISFSFTLLFYFLFTTLYSLIFKSIVLLDCFSLAFLYTLRIFAGAVACEIPLTFWFLAFSVFIFLSLAFLKRHAELLDAEKSNIDTIKGRGYLRSDLMIVQQIGIISGFIGVLILCLYINSDSVKEVYSSPNALWASVPILLFWVCWVWVASHRGKMHHDPIVFAVKDRVSCFLGLIFISSFFCAYIY